MEAIPGHIHIAFVSQAEKDDSWPGLKTKQKVAASRLSAVAGNHEELMIIHLHRAAITIITVADIHGIIRWIYQEDG